MGIFGRIFNVGKAEAHAIVDKLEDPIKMTEQGIRDLKKDLDKKKKSEKKVGLTFRVTLSLSLSHPRICSFCFTTNTDTDGSFSRL